MPKRPEDLDARALAAADGEGRLPLPPLDERETFPFDGHLRVRLIVRIERAVAAVEGVRRVHVGRWGDGSAHLHWWFMGRPARLPQLVGSFAAIWDDILPPLPEALWRENVACVARALAAGGGTCHVV